MTECTWCGHEPHAAACERKIETAEGWVPCPCAQREGNFITSEPAPCLVCTLVTDQVEVNFEGHVHPGDCERRLWADYAQALRR